MKFGLKALSALALASTVMVSGCASVGGNTAAGTGVGAALGAGLGALIGDSSKAAGIGAGIGAIAGAITGYNWDKIVGKVASSGGKLGVKTEKMPDGSLKVVVPENAGFDTGSATLKPAIYPVLDALSTSMVSDKKLRVKTVGNTDNKGSATLNQQLSEKRAVSVASYLADKGVAVSSITVEGRSFNDPVASNDTAAGRAMNRRAEIYLYAVK